MVANAVQERDRARKLQKRSLFCANKIWLHLDPKCKLDMVQRLIN